MKNEKKIVDLTLIDNPKYFKELCHSILASCIELDYSFILNEQGININSVDYCNDIVIDPINTKLLKELEEVADELNAFCAPYPDEPTAFCNSGLIDKKRIVIPIKVRKTKWVKFISKNINKELNMPNVTLFKYKVDGEKTQKYKLKEFIKEHPEYKSKK